MAANRLWTSFFAGALVCAVACVTLVIGWPVISAGIQGCATLITSVSCRLSAAVGTPRTGPVGTPVTPPIPAATAGTDPALVAVLQQNSLAITRMAESQQETTKALQQNTAVLQQMVVQMQQPRPVTPTPPTASCCSARPMQLP